MMWSLTGLFVVLAALAGWSMHLGNPTAINGVIGAGIGALVFGSIALMERY